MIGQHTQGRLVVEGGLLYSEQIGNEYGYQVAIVAHEQSDFPSDRIDANARRLAACWNACIGFETETLVAADLHESAYAAEGREFELTRERDQLRAELDAARALLAEKFDLPTADPVGTVLVAADRLVSMADIMGVVLTVSQEPRHPLAMGNYDTVVSVRPARVMA